MTSIVSLDARPAPIALDVETTAVIVVDMQNDFGSEGGMFHRAGLDISKIQAAVAPIGRVLNGARSVGIKVLYLKMGFPADLSMMGPADAPNRVRHLQFGVGQEVTIPEGGVGRVLIRDTWGTDIVDELSPQPGDTVLYKHRFSGFFETELHDWLKSHSIRQLVVVGCTTSVCVESTVRDAFFRDYQAVVLADCTAEPLGDKAPRSNHDASLLTIEVMLGWVSSSEQLTAALSMLPASQSANTAASAIRVEAA
jgi:ureidoacrylate peracid hydrolase